MKMKKMLFIYNPRAGKGLIKSNLFDIITIFTNGGYELTVHPTKCRNDATEQVIERAKDFDVISCCGGDGTLDEVVTGMLQLNKEDRVPIGYIPAGSTNDFAKSLRIPTDMKAAAEGIVDGKVFPCDAGRFGEDCFVYVAAFGLFTDVSYATDQGMKNVLGHAAYLLEGTKRLANITGYEMRVTCDDTVYEGDYVYGMITNSRSVGGFSLLTGNAVDLSDGYFEVCLIKRPKNIMDLNQIVMSMLNDSMDNEYIQSVKAKKVVIQCQFDVPWTLDGEYGGRHKQIEIINDYHSIELIVPSLEDAIQA